jgi:hypothetical protein
MSHILFVPQLSDNTRQKLAPLEAQQREALQKYKVRNTP